MNEQAPPPDAVPADSAQEVAATPDRSLTLRPGRRAGSPACLNCGTPLKGPFCYYCGQPDRNFLRFFPALLREFMEDFLELDSRFARTLKPLLFKPGRLTRDYLEGRRFRYTPPMRLYLFSSIAFFLLAAFLSSNAISINGAGDAAGDKQNVNILIGTDLLQSRLEEAGVEDAESVARAIAESGVELQAGETVPAVEEDFTTDQIMINGEPWHREDNPVEIRFMPEIFNDWINDEIGQSPEKAMRIKENPDLIVDKIFDILPGTMFVLLPVVALLFKFWYLFAKRYYIEHLILALHNHTFVFVSLILVLLLNFAGDWFGSRNIGPAQSAVGWLVTAISIWMPLYMLLSLRHVYRQNWFLTVCKFGAIGLSYFTLLIFVTSIVAVLGFVLL